MRRWKIPVLVLAMSAACSGCRGPDHDLPAAYRGIEVPARLGSPGARARGRELFLRYCALCHGVRADGHGDRQIGLAKAPADFTRPSWRSGVTPRRVYHAIREGVRGTPMLSFKAIDEDDCWDLAAYVLSVSAEGR